MFNLQILCPYRVSDVALLEYGTFERVDAALVVARLPEHLLAERVVALLLPLYVLLCSWTEDVEAKIRRRSEESEISRGSAKFDTQRRENTAWTVREFEPSGLYSPAWACEL